MAVFCNPVLIMKIPFILHQSLSCSTKSENVANLWLNFCECVHMFVGVRGVCALPLVLISQRMISGFPLTGRPVSKHSRRTPIFSQIAFCIHLLVCSTKCSIAELDRFPFSANSFSFIFRPFDFNCLPSIAPKCINPLMLVNRF